MAPARLYLIHDHALTIELDLPIGNLAHKKVKQLHQKIQEQFSPLLVELIPSYTSISICFLPHLQAKDYLKEIESILATCKDADDVVTDEPTSLVKIPVCYDVAFGLDLLPLSNTLKISMEEIIALHIKKVYSVYAVGFVPGFPYMGEVDDKIAVPRKEKPVLQIAPGSVAIANQQTGIYPFKVPGGWHLIGRTPLTLFNKTTPPYSLLQPGQSVQFYAITKTEFENWV
jgi:inhibitor of KinA